MKRSVLTLTSTKVSHISYTTAYKKIGMEQKSYHLSDSIITHSVSSHISQVLVNVNFVYNPNSLVTF